MSIEAMKMALESLEYDTRPDTEYGINTAIEILSTAIEQAEKQEPVAWNIQHNRPPLESDSPHEVVALVRCEWVGLTDEESAELTYASIAEIEAKLKEKNT